MRSSRKRRRAWRLITEVAIVAALVLTLLTLILNAMGGHVIAEFLAPLAGLLLLLVLGWAIVGMPWFWSGDTDFDEASPPQRRERFLLVLVSIPAFVMTAVPAITLASGLLSWWGGSEWEWPDSPNSGWLMGTVLCIVYAIVYGGIVRRRLRFAAQRTRVCFNCAYSLAEIPNSERCPECGRGVDMVEP